MRNSLCSGNVFEYVAPAGGVASGALVEMGSVVGVAAISGAEGDPVTVNVSGVYEVPKVAGAVSQGAKLYYVDATQNLSTADGGGANTLAGYAYKAALNGDATVFVKLLF